LKKSSAPCGADGVERDATSKKEKGSKTAPRVIGYPELLFAFAFLMSTTAELIGLAKQQHRAGRLDEAEQLYRQVLQAEPKHAEALHLIGVLCLQRGRHDLAISYIEQALAISPPIAVFHNNLGLAHQALGQWDQAASYYRQAAHLQPDYAVAYANLGAVLQSQGKATEAEKHLRHAIRLQPRHAQAHTILGNALAEQGKLDDAVACHQLALRLEPNLVDAHVNLGSVFFAQGDLKGAVACYDKALRLQPNSVPGLVSLASVLVHQGKTDEAIQCYRKALSVKPDDAEIHHHLGAALCSRGDGEEAIICQRHALQLRPDYAEAHADLGHALSQEHRLEEALIAYESAARWKPTAATRIRAAIMLPAIYRSLADLDKWRRRFTDKLEILHKEHVILDVTKDKATFQFYLAFQGMNDRDLNHQVARLYAAPQGDFSPPRILSASAGRGGAASGSQDKIRVGFISNHFKRHTIGVLMRGMIAQLSRDKFVVIVLSVGSHSDGIARWIQEHADTYVEVPYHLPAARRLITDQRLDVLFYTDLGMDAITYTLAFSRLAPVQCVTWGHPVTTGIDTIDYFISSEHLETSASEQHYTERLVRLKNPAIYYYRPKPPTPLKSRAFYGLPGDGALYACPQSLFKFHPEFDDILGGILRKDPHGVLVLIGSKKPHAEHLLRQRFTATISDVLKRIHFLPTLDHHDFLNLNAVADVLLDPIHFGGGNTSYEALAFGVPIVTLPSVMLRGRITWALYQQMGVPDCAVRTPKEYIDLAVRLGTDADYRAHMGARIKSASDVIFENIEGVRELEAFFQEAVCHDRTNPKFQNSNPKQIQSPNGQ
jgi:protein O-GlcNAc transferase